MVFWWVFLCCRRKKDFAAERAISLQAPPVALFQPATLGCFSREQAQEFTTRRGIRGANVLADGLDRTDGRVVRAKKLTVGFRLIE